MTTKLTPEDIESIKNGAMDNLGIKANRRFEVKRVLDYAIFLVLNGMTPDQVHIATKKEVSDTQNKHHVAHPDTVASPYNALSDHQKFKAEKERQVMQSVISNLS